MPTETSENVRIKIYKNKGKDTEELRRKRTDLSIELRKAKKDEQLLKKRNVTTDALSPVSPLQEMQQNVQQEVFTMQEIAAGLFSSDAGCQLAAAQGARKILSKQRNPPIQDFIDGNLLLPLVQFLDADDKPDLQFEAAWALTNIASGSSDQTRAVVQSGAAAKFIKLLSSSHATVSEQAVWAIGNIAGDGPELRDYLIENGVIPPLVALVTPNAKDPFLQNIAWTISNLCRNKNPPPSESAVRQCLPTLSALLHKNETAILCDTCWAFCYLTDGVNERIQLIVDAGVVPRLTELLRSEHSSVVTPALRAVGNIVTGSDVQTQSVIDSPGTLQAFHALLSHEKSTIQKEAAWALSNMTAGNVAQIQSVIDAQLIPDVIELIKTGDYRSKKEAAWVLANLTTGGNVEQVSYIVNCGALPCLCDLLLVNDSKVVLVTLDALKNILSAAGKVGCQTRVCELIEEAGGLDKLESLQEHENEDIYKEAVSFIDKYFSDYGDDEDQSVIPTVTANGDGFEFNQSATSSGINF